MRSQVSGRPDLELEAVVDRRNLRFMGDAAAYAYLSMKQAIARRPDARAGVQPAQRPGGRLWRRVELQPGLGGRHTARQGHQARRPLHGDPHHGQHRVGLPGHAVWHQGCQLLHHLGLRHQRALHRPCRAADRLGSAGRGLRRRRRGRELGAVAAVRRHGRHVQQASTTSRTRQPRLRCPATASSSPAAAAWWCWRAGARPGARREPSMPKSSAIGATSDGYDMVAPSGEGAVRCMQQALATVKTPDRLPEPARHLDAGGRPGKELEAVREVFRTHSADQLDQVAVGPLAGRGRRAGGHLLPADDGRRLHRRVGQHREPRPRCRGPADPAASAGRAAAPPSCPTASASAAPTPRWC
jgi:3-oxoacyl-[acyl-carrier-protein] synthase-1